MDQLGYGGCRRCPISYLFRFLYIMFDQLSVGIVRSRTIQNNLLDWTFGCMLQFTTVLRNCVSLAQRDWSVWIRIQLISLRNTLEHRPDPKSSYRQNIGPSSRIGIGPDHGSSEELVSVRVSARTPIRKIYRRRFCGISIGIGIDGVKVQLASRPGVRVLYTLSEQFKSSRASSSSSLVQITNS